MIETTTNATILIVIIGAILVMLYQHYEHKKEVKKRVSLAVNQAIYRCKQVMDESKNWSADNYASGFLDGAERCKEQMEEMRKML